MSKHTPKDWYIEPGDYNSLFVSTTDSGSIVICQVFSNDVFDNPMPPEMVRANARLIAAAPALLDACEAMVKAYPYEDTNQNEPDGLCHCPTCEAYRIGKAAIRMAKGTDND